MTGAAVISLRHGIKRGAARSFNLEPAQPPSLLIQGLPVQGIPFWFLSCYFATHHLQGIYEYPTSRHS